MSTVQPFWTTHSERRIAFALIVEALLPGLGRRLIGIRASLFLSLSTGALVLDFLTGLSTGNRSFLNLVALISVVGLVIRLFWNKVDSRAMVHAVGQSSLRSSWRFVGLYLAMICGVFPFAFGAYMGTDPGQLNRVFVLLTVDLAIHAVPLAIGAIVAISARLRERQIPQFTIILLSSLINVLTMYFAREVMWFTILGPWALLPLITKVIQ